MDPAQYGSMVDMQSVYQGCTASRQTTIHFPAYTSTCKSRYIVCFRPTLVVLIEPNALQHYKAAHQPNSRGLLLPSSFCSTLSRLPPSHSSMTTMFCKPPPTLSVRFMSTKLQVNRWLALLGRHHHVCGLYPSMRCFLRCSCHFQSFTASLGA